jgi:hypothetical protein
MAIDNISTSSSSTPAETQVAPSNRAEQLDRLRDLEDLVGNLLDAAQEVELLACEIADADDDQGDVYDAAQVLLHEVDIATPVVGALRYLTAAVKDEWAQPDLFDESNKGGDKNDGAAA